MCGSLRNLVCASGGDWVRLDAACRTGDRCQRRMGGGFYRQTVGLHGENAARARARCRRRSCCTDARASTAHLLPCRRLAWPRLCREIRVGSDLQGDLRRVEQMFLHDPGSYSDFGFP